MIKIYPLKLVPAYQAKIWGSESWVVSDIPGAESVVSEGPLQGKNLSEVTEEWGIDLLGHHVMATTGRDFPLLVKLIDARDTLSVQVHPNDAYAAEHHNSFGKTEMWYLLATDPGAIIYAGWRKGTYPKQLRELVKSAEVLEYVHALQSQPGDLFFLPSGKVHAIGGGNRLLEIQQRSDITYRLYDFDRVDSEGRLRDLHIDQAVEVIDYRVDTQSTTSYDRTTTDTLVTMVQCRYFKTSRIGLTSRYTHLLRERDSFTVLFCASGSLSVIYSAGEVQLTQGETLLLPAALESALLSPTSAYAEVIDTYVPVWK